MALPSTPGPSSGAESAVRILVVDDEPAVRHLLKRWIHRAFSIETSEAEHGLQALELLTTGRFDLVITDLNMPVLDGIEMLSLIRADPAHAQLEVIVATAVGGEDKVRAAISMGVADYLLKPLQHELVIGRLKAAIDRLAENRRIRSEGVDHSRTRVLIADRDPNFCEFACASLGREFAAVSVRTTAQVLVRVLRWKPDAIVISRDLPGTPLEFLVGKIRSIAKPGAIAVYLLGETGDEQVDFEVQGVIKRTFVPEAFCSGIVSLLQGGAAPLEGILAWLPALEPEVQTAVRQSLGMLAGGEPLRLTELPPDTLLDCFAKIELESASEGIRLRLGMRANLSFAASIVLAMIGGEESDLDVESKRSGVQEVLNAVAGRIKSACESRQIDLKIGLPEFGAAEFGAVGNAVYERKFSYRWQEAYAFELLLSAAAETAAGGGDGRQPEAAAPCAEPAA